MTRWDRLCSGQWERPYAREMFGKEGSGKEMGLETGQVGASVKGLKRQSKSGLDLPGAGGQLEGSEQCSHWLELASEAGHWWSMDCRGWGWGQLGGCAVV